MKKFEFDYISLDLIDPNPINQTIYTEDDIEHLAEKIRSEGFKHPVKLFKKTDGRYEISSGHRRVKAMKLLGEKTVPSIITDPPKTEYEKTRDLLSGNLEQRRTSPLEKALEIEAYKKSLVEEKFKGNKRKKIAEYFNITESNVYRYECILKLIPELQEYCKDPEFPYSSLRQVAAFSEEEQRTVLQKMIELEASEKNLTEDEIDRAELIFSRTRIEQIVNNTIRQKERKERELKNARILGEAPVREEKQASEPSDGFMPSPVEAFSESPDTPPAKSTAGADIDFSQFVVKEEEEVVYEIEEFLPKTEYLLSASINNLKMLMRRIEVYEMQEKNEIVEQLATLQAIIKEIEKKIK